MPLPKPPNNDQLTPGERVSMTPGPDPKETIKVSSGEPELEAADIMGEHGFDLLSLPEKHKALMMTTDYKALPAKEQANFLNLAHYGEQGTKHEQQERAKAASAKGFVKDISYALPVATGIAGAGIGSMVPGAGTVAGGGLGTAAGETARQGIIHSLFPEEPSPTSKEGLEQTAEWGTLGAVSELPGAIARGYGRSVLRSLAEAKSPREVGNVIDAFNRAHPFALSREGLTGAIKDANSELSGKLSSVYKLSPGTTDIDPIVQRTQAFANAADKQFAQQMGKPGYKNVTNTLNRIIAAAKTKSGIPVSTVQAAAGLAPRGVVSSGGTQVSVKELAAFQQELKQVVKYESKTNPTVAGVVQDMLKQTYRDIGGEIDRLAPPARPLLDRMTDNHAALSALKNYKPGAIKSAAITAATHPATTRVISPALGPVTALGGRQAYKGAKAIGELVP